MNQVAPIYERVSKMSRPLPSSISALVVDDNNFDRKRVHRVCDDADLSIKINEVSSVAEMREALDAAKFDLVIVDYHLGEENGLIALEHIQSHPENGDAATIMIAGEGQAEIAVTALKRGCSDYIVKENLNPESLRRAIINALQKSQLVKSLNSEAEMRSIFETMLNGLKRECIQEMRPMLSKMLLKLRQGKSSGHTGGGSIAGAHLDEVEKSCLRLFSFLDDIEKFQPESSK